jgi:hypothetical protein
MILICFLVFCFLAVLEFKKSKMTFIKTIFTVKTMILLFCALFLGGNYIIPNLVIEAFCHYSFFNNSALISVSLSVLECLRFISFFLVCYFFCNLASGILPNNKYWLLFLKVFLILMIGFMITALVFMDRKIIKTAILP